MEEAKVSSSSNRIRMLGNKLKPTPRSWNWQEGPYVIGLTGGIASGKSSVAKRLAHLGAVTIDCDILGHKAYEVGTTCYRKVVEEFGPHIVRDEDDSIDRRKLGSIVFNSRGSSLITTVTYTSMLMECSGSQRRRQSWNQLCGLKSRRVSRLSWRK